jgi:hypothetical protein
MCIRKGLTLIELLVLFIIIVILLVILMQVGGTPESLPISDPNLPPTSTQVIDKIVKELEWGNIVFNAPTSMRFKETEAIELLLSHSVSIQELRTQLEKANGIESASVQISNRIEARLSGTGFQVEALFPEVQTVGSKGVIQWKWYVTPTEHGLQRLHLTLSAILTVSDRDAPFVIRTFDRTIDVEISLAQRASSFFSKNWKWLWAAILVPVVGYLWRRHYKAKHEAT